MFGFSVAFSIELPFHFSIRCQEEKLSGSHKAHRVRVNEGEVRISGLLEGFASNHVYMYGSVLPLHTR